MEIAIFQFVIGAKKEIFEKMLQIIRCRMNIILQIVVIGAHKGIAKIPGMVFERFIIDWQPKSFHIFEDEDGDRAGITLTKWVDLPDARCERRQVSNGLLQSQTVVGKKRSFSKS